VTRLRSELQPHKLLPGTALLRPNLLPKFPVDSRIGLLRAVVIGKDDLFVSTANLIVGVAAVGSGRATELVAGRTCLVSKGDIDRGRRVLSVMTLSDTARADRARERAEPTRQPDFEREESTQITIGFGALAFSAHNVCRNVGGEETVDANLLDKLCIWEVNMARLRLTDQT